MIETMSPERQKFLEFVLEKKGLPYIWSHKGLPHEKEIGFDCSGLVTAGIYHASDKKIDWRADHNCNILFNELKVVEFPLPGDLAFYGYGKNMLSHVMIHMADGRVYGACGGNSYTTSAEKAAKINACVRFRGKSPNGHQYRPDYVASCRLPF